jgi:uncharacterized protein YlbG (UPF0298 family)
MSQDSGDSAGDEHLQRTLVATGNGVDINVEKMLTKSFVKDMLFSHVKFLQPENLESASKVSNMVRRHLKYNREDLGPLWEKVVFKRVVKKVVNEKRNGISQNIAKQEAKSKCVLIFVCAYCLRAIFELSCADSFPALSYL